jgi:hypothetical protein
MKKNKTFLLQGHETHVLKVLKSREDIDEVHTKILHCSNINTDSPLTSIRFKLEK